MNFWDALWELILHHTILPAPPPPPPRPVPPPVPPVPSGDVAAQLLGAHNVERVKRGHPALVSHPALVASASGHAAFMAKVGKLAHIGIGDSDPFTRMTRAGYSWRTAGENAASGQWKVIQVMSDWMSDRPHAENVLGDYVHMGGGMAVAADGMPYWCVDFGSPG